MYPNNLKEMALLMLAALLIAFLPLLAPTVKADPGMTIKRDADYRNVMVVEFEADASGDATYTTGATCTGMLLGVVFVPDGTTPPNAEWDVSMADSSGHDCFSADAIGTDLSATANTYRTPKTADSYPYWFFKEAITVTVSNAGDGGKGKIYLYFEE